MTADSQLELARKKFESGQFEACATLCRDLAAQDNVDAVHLLALIAHREKRYDDAVTGLEEAIRLDSGRADMHNHLGAIYGALARNEDAIASLRSALAIDPRLPDAHFNLGNALRGEERHEEAIGAYKSAAAIQDAWPELHFNLGNALRDTGKLEEAAASYRKAVDLRPAYVKAHNNLGNIFREQGNYEEAADCYRQALSFKHDYLEACFNLGAVLRHMGRTDESISEYREAVARGPESPDAHHRLGIALKLQGLLTEAAASFQRALDLNPSLAKAHTELGIVYRKQEELDQAVECFQRALKCGDESLEAYGNLIDLLRGQDRLEEAEAYAREAVKAEHESEVLYNVYGATLYALGKVPEAIDAYRQALRLKPDLVDAQNNLGVALQAMCDYEEGEDCFETALRTRPDFALARLNRALTWLRGGNYEQGWLEYEWRRCCADHRLRDFRQPLWDGSPLGGQRILLHAEQGVGDTFQFIRYAALVKDRAGHVIVESHGAAHPLVKDCRGVDRCIRRGQPLPKFDVQVPLLSLPGIFGTNAATIPCEVPYLFADDKLVGEWRDRIGDESKFKVGIGWQGNKKYKGDHLRSIPLRCFEALRRAGDVRFFSLQKSEGTEQMQELSDEFDLVAFPDLDTSSGPFMDTAALIANLSLVITSDTALAHLAGGLGAPVWVALPYSADWRWGESGESCPWYPHDAAISTAGICRLGWRLQSHSRRAGCSTMRRCIEAPARAARRARLRLGPRRARRTH